MNQNIIEAKRLKLVISNTLNDNELSDSLFSKLLSELDLLISDDLSSEIDVEVKLEEIAFKFRKAWLEYSSTISSSHYRSPLHGKSVNLPNSGNIKYDYERVATTENIDNRCINSCTKLKDWDVDCTFFTTGMSAIHVVLSQLFIYIRQNNIDTPRVLAEHGLYFETIALFRFLDRQGGFDIDYMPYSEILSNIESLSTDIIFLEPVLCNLNQSILNFDFLIQSIKKRNKNQLLFVVIDNSIVGSAFDMSYILERVGVVPNLVFIDVQSGLKLYQEGLEFSNVGFTKIYTLKEEHIKNMNYFYSHASSIKKQFARLRKVYGVGLSLKQFTVFDALWFLNAEYYKEYISTLHINNAYIAKKLAKTDGIFKDVHHTSLSELADKPWAQSPFIYLSFREEEDSDENMDMLKKIILYEIQKLNITLYYGTSFGFRHHRFEIYEMFNEDYASGKERHVVRLCIGYRQGFSLKNTLMIFLKIARYKSFKQLSTHYNPYLLKE